MEHMLLPRETPTPAALQPFKKNWLHHIGAFIFIALCVYPLIFLFDRNLQKDYVEDKQLYVSHLLFRLLKAAGLHETFLVDLLTVGALGVNILVHFATAWELVFTIFPAIKRAPISFALLLLAPITSVATFATIAHNAHQKDVKTQADAILFYCNLATVALSFGIFFIAALSNIAAALFERDLFSGCRQQPSELEQRALELEKAARHKLNEEIGQYKKYLCANGENPTAAEPTAAAATETTAPASAQPTGIGKLIAQPYRLSLVLLYYLGIFPYFYGGKHTWEEAGTGSVPAYLLGILGTLGFFPSIIRACTIPLTDFIPYMVLRETALDRAIMKSLPRLLSGAIQLVGFITLLLSFCTQGSTESLMSGLSNEFFKPSSHTLTKTIVMAVFEVLGWLAASLINLMWAAQAVKFVRDILAQIYFKCIPPGDNTLRNLQQTLMLGEKSQVSRFYNICDIVTFLSDLETETRDTHFSGTVAALNNFSALFSTAPAPEATEASADLAERTPGQSSALKPQDNSGEKQRVLEKMTGIGCPPNSAIFDHPLITRIATFTPGLS